MVHVSLQEGFLSKVESLKGVQHVVILSQVLFIFLSEMPISIYLPMNESIWVVF